MLIDVQNNDGIFPMIQAGRADFTLYSFSTEPDLGSRPTYSPSRILPIRGFKVAFRPAATSPWHAPHPTHKRSSASSMPASRLLRERGAIKRVFERSGVFEPRVADWQLVGNN